MYHGVFVYREGGGGGEKIDLVGVSILMLSWDNVGFLVSVADGDFFLKSVLVFV